MSSKHRAHTWHSTGLWHPFVRGAAREQHAPEERLDVLQLRIRRRPLQGLCCAELGVQRFRLVTGTK